MVRRFLALADRRHDPPMAGARSGKPARYACRVPAGPEGRKWTAAGLAHDFIRLAYSVDLRA